MAKKGFGSKRSKDTENTVADAPSNVVASQSEQPVTATETNNDTVTKDSNVMTFTKVSTHKNGLTSYSTPGLRGSIYVAKGVFGESGAPETIEVTGEGMIVPTAEQVEKARKRAERKTRVRATLAERAAKAEEKAKKAAERAAKLAARLAKQNAPAGTVAAAEGTGEPAHVNDPAFEAPAVPVGAAE